MAPSIKKRFSSENELCRHGVCHQSIEELGQLDDSVCGTGPLQRWLLKFLIGQSRSLSLLCTILGLIWHQNDKRTRESKVMRNQSVPLWQLEESCSWAETKGCTQDLYKLLHLHSIAWEKKKKKKKSKDYVSSGVPGNRTWPCHTESMPTTKSGAVSQLQLYCRFNPPPTAQHSSPYSHPSAPSQHQSTHSP